jgi:quercetin 2,3-dioxygenase
MYSTQAKIFLGEERGILEKEHAQLFCVFEEEAFTHPHKKAFGNLFRFNEILIDASSRVSRSPGQTLSRIYIILLPSMGAINCTIAGGEEVTIAAGQAYSFILPYDSGYSLANPFSDGVVGLVEVALAINDDIELGPLLVTYPITTQPDTLLLFNHVNSFIKASIGVFAGRKEAVYHYQSSQHHLFSFVLQGAFELEGRLLHAKDALAIWDTESIELEALSNNAIILLVEFLSTP